MKYYIVENVGKSFFPKLISTHNTYSEAMKSFSEIPRDIKIRTSILKGENGEISGSMKIKLKLDNLIGLSKCAKG